MISKRHPQPANMGNEFLHGGGVGNPFAHNRNRHRASVQHIHWTVIAILMCMGLALWTAPIQLAAAAPAHATTPPPEDIQATNLADNDRSKRGDDTSCCNKNVASKCLCFGIANVTTKATTSLTAVCGSLSGTTLLFSGRCYGEYLPDALAANNELLSLPNNINEVYIKDITVRPGGPLPKTLLDRLSGALTKISIRNAEGFQAYLPNLLSSIPFISHLDLSSNGLQDLQANAFNGMKALTHLNLSDNKLGVLPDNLFKDNTLLRLIDFSQNKLKLLPRGLFSGLAALEDVSLAGNPIGLLPEGLFVSNIALKSMNFSNAMLRDIGEGIFPSSVIPLETLDLSENMLWRVLTHNLPKSNISAQVQLYLQGTKLNVPLCGVLPMPYVNNNISGVCPCVDMNFDCDEVCQCGGGRVDRGKCSNTDDGLGRACFVDKIGPGIKLQSPSDAFPTYTTMKTLAEGTVCACLVANYRGSESRAMEPLPNLAGKSYEQVQSFCSALIKTAPRDSQSSSAQEGALGQDGCKQLCQNDGNCQAVTYVEMSASCIAFGNASGTFPSRQWTRLSNLAINRRRRRSTPMVWATVGSDRSQEILIEASFRPPVSGDYSFAIPMGTRFLIYEESKSGSESDFTAALNEVTGAKLRCPDGENWRCGGLCCPPAFHLLIADDHQFDFNNPMVWQNMRGDPYGVDNCRCVNPAHLPVSGSVPKCGDSKQQLSPNIESILGQWVSDGQSIFRYRLHGDYCYDSSDPKFTDVPFSVCQAIGDVRIVGALHTADGKDRRQVPTCKILLKKDKTIAYKVRLLLKGPLSSWVPSHLLSPNWPVVESAQARWSSYTLDCNVPYNYGMFGELATRFESDPGDVDAFAYIPILSPESGVGGMDRLYLARCNSPIRQEKPAEELPFSFDAAMLTEQFFGYAVIPATDANFDKTVLGAAKQATRLVPMPSGMTETSFFDFATYLTEDVHPPVPPTPVVPDASTNVTTTIVTWGCYAPSEFDEIQPFSGVLPTATDRFDDDIPLIQSAQKVTLGGTEPHALFFVPPVSANTHLPTIAVTLLGEDSRAFTARGFNQVTGLSVTMPALATILSAKMESLSPTPRSLIVARKSNAVHFNLDNCRQTPSVCKQFPSAVTVGVMPSSVTWICEETGPSTTRKIGTSTVPTSALGIGVDFRTSMIGAAVGSWEFLQGTGVDSTHGSLRVHLEPGASVQYPFKTKTRGTLLVDGVRIYSSSSPPPQVVIVFHDARASSAGIASTVTLKTENVDSVVLNDGAPGNNLYEWSSFVVGDANNLTITNAAKTPVTFQFMLRGEVTETCHMAVAFDVARFDEERFDDGYLAIQNVTITLPFVQLSRQAPLPTLPTTLIARDYTGLLGSQFGGDLTVDIATVFGHGIANKMGNRFCELKRNDEHAAYVCDLAASKELSDTIKTWMRGAQARVIFSPAAFQLNKNVEIPVRATAEGILWSSERDFWSKLTLAIHYEVYRWVVATDWAPACPAQTSQTRIVVCTNRANTTVDPTYCAPLHRPADAQSCGASSTPPLYVWHSLCHCPCTSGDCRTATDEPMVFCVNSAMNTTVDEGLCAGVDKPNITTCGEKCKCDVDCSGCWSALAIAGEAGQCTRDMNSSAIAYSRPLNISCNLCKGQSVVFLNVSQVLCEGPPPPGRVTCSPTEVLESAAVWDELQSLRIVQISAERSTKETEIMLGVPTMEARQALAEAEAAIAEAELHILATNSLVSMEVPVVEAEAALLTAKVEVLRQSETLRTKLIEQTIATELVEARTRERQALAGLVEPLAGRTLPRIEVLGAGFNLVRGNPHCTDDPFGMGGIVPLVDLSYTTMTLVGNKFLPDGVYATELSTAEFNSNMEILTSESELRESAKMSLKFSTSFSAAEELSSEKTAFSMNTQFSTETEKIRSSKDVFVRNKVTVTVARMNLLPNIADVARPSKSLYDYWRSIKVDDDCCVDSSSTDCIGCNALDRMPDVFGTHLMKAVTLGCIGLQQLQLDVVEVKKLVDNEMSADSEASNEQSEGKTELGMGETTKVSTEVSVALKRAMQSSSSSTQQKIEEKYLGGIPQPGGFFDDGQVNNDALKTYAGTCIDNPFITDYTLMRVDEFIEQMGPSKFDEDRDVFVAKLKKFRIIMREYCAGIMNCAPDSRDVDRIDPVKFNDLMRFTYTHSNTSLYTLSITPNQQNVRLSSDISGEKDSMYDLSPDDEVCFPTVMTNQNLWVNDPDILDFPGLAWWLSDSPNFPGCSARRHGSCAGEFKILRVVPAAKTYVSCRQACQDTSSCVAGTFVSNPNGDGKHLSPDMYHDDPAQCVLFLSSMLTENTIMYAWNFDNHMNWRQHWRGRMISWRCGSMPLPAWDPFGLRSFRKEYADGDNSKEESLFRLSYPVEEHIDISDKTLRYGKGFLITSKNGCLSKVEQDAVSPVRYRWSVINVASSMAEPDCVIFRFLSRVQPIGSIVSYADSVFIEASTNFTIMRENYVFNRRPSLFVAPGDPNGILSSVVIVAENSPGSDLQSFSWSLSRGASLSVLQTIGEGTTSEYTFEASASVDQRLTSATITIKFTVPVSRVSFPVALAAAAKTQAKESVATYALRLIKSDFVVTMRRNQPITSGLSSMDEAPASMRFVSGRQSDDVLYVLNVTFTSPFGPQDTLFLSLSNPDNILGIEKQIASVAAKLPVPIVVNMPTSIWAELSCQILDPVTKNLTAIGRLHFSQLVMDYDKDSVSPSDFSVYRDNKLVNYAFDIHARDAGVAMSPDDTITPVTSATFSFSVSIPGGVNLSSITIGVGAGRIFTLELIAFPSSARASLQGALANPLKVCIMGAGKAWYIGDSKDGDGTGTIPNGTPNNPPSNPTPVDKGTKPVDMADVQQLVNDVVSSRTAKIASETGAWGSAATVGAVMGSLSFAALLVGGVVAYRNRWTLKRMIRRETRFMGGNAADIITNENAGFAPEMHNPLRDMQMPQTPAPAVAADVGAPAAEDLGDGDDDL